MYPPAVKHQNTAKMGIVASQCVQLSWAPNAAAYLGDTYTVIRTSGATDDGWLISSEPHRCEAVRANYLWSPSSHAHLTDGVWRVFLINTKSGTEHSCGWRRVGTFWPTRLTGDQAAIDAWCEELKKALGVEAKKLEQSAASESSHCCDAKAPEPSHCCDAKASEPNGCDAKAPEVKAE